MRSIDFDRRRLEGLRARALAQRASVQIIVGALAIAAIVLAFVFRPGQAATESNPTAAAKPTATVGAVVVVPTPTVVAAAPTKEPSRPTERIHTVVSGDTLSSIASKYYGDASKYQKIFEANTDILKTPDSLQIGQKLKIPD